RRTTLPPEELDSYIFASEIAIRKMLDKGSPSPDDILCDPSQASQFDQIARAFAPGFSSLQYRWAALRIRKRARDARKHQARVPRDFLQRRFPRFQPINEVEMGQVKAKSGVYLLRTAPDRHLYAGATLDLGGRLKRTLESFEPWREISTEIHI